MDPFIRAIAPALAALAIAITSNDAGAWTFSNSDAGDGTLSGAYPSFMITGSDNGSGDNTSFYLQTFTAPATIRFTWSYASLDSGGTVYDPAGYILDGTETQLSVDADPFTPSSGSASVGVEAGDTFGFYVHSLDSLGGAGFLSVNEPLVLPSPVAEPSRIALTVAGIAALLVAARRRAIG
jgi:hypothetical protein